MKYTGMPMGMWVLFSKSFRDKLISVFGYRAGEAGPVQDEYRELRNAFCVSSRHGEKAGCGETDRLKISFGG